MPSLTDVPNETNKKTFTSKTDKYENRNEYGKPIQI